LQRNTYRGDEIVPETLTFMKLKELIKNLQKLIDKGYGDLPVYATHGASGACDPVSYPYLRKTDGEELGELCEEEIGTPYIDISIGD